MNPHIIRITALAGLVLGTLTAPLVAVPININTSFGAVDPGTPANASTEVLFISNLLTISPVGENAPSYPPLLDDGTFANTGVTVYDRFNVVVPAGAPAPTATGGAQGNTSGNVVNLGSGWSYLLAKFGNTSYVWYIAGLVGTLELPTTLGTGGGLSHFSLYNPGGTSVPDGGATVALLGLALTALAFARRKLC